MKLAIVALMLALAGCTSFPKPKSGDPVTGFQAACQETGNEAQPVARMGDGIAWQCGADPVAYVADDSGALVRAANADEVRLAQEFAYWAAACAPFGPAGSPGNLQCVQTRMMQQAADRAALAQQQANGIALMGVGAALLQQSQQQPCNNVISSSLGGGVTSYRCW